jgi:hypothetical protein
MWRKPLSEPAAMSRGAHSLPIRVWPPYEQDFYAVASTSSLKGVCKAAIDLIGEEQPYKAGNEAAAKLHYLAVLKSLADTDKHKALFVTATVPSDPSQIRNLVHFPGAKGPIQLRILLEPGQSLEPGTDVALIHVGPFDPDQKVYMDGPITLGVQFRDAAGGESAGELRGIKDKVGSLVGRLERFVT